MLTTILNDLLVCGINLNNPTPIEYWGRVFYTCQNFRSVHKRYSLNSTYFVCTDSGYQSEFSFVTVLMSIFSGNSFKP